MLEVEHIGVAYGEVQAVWDASLRVEAGQVVALLGANGAGKSTTLRAISGVVRTVSGRILFEGEPVHHLPADRIVDRGIIHVPEGRGIFSTLTVRENLELGAYIPRARRHMRESLEQVYHLFPVLKEREKQLAGSLSGGEQQMCAIGRGLMARPVLLMIDEMSLGLAPLLVVKMFETVRQITASGVSCLLVEQHVRHALEISDYVFVMEKGRTALEGRADQLLDDPRFHELYLGTQAAAG